MADHFQTFEAAASYARNDGRPIMAWVGAARWTVFPNGKTVLALSVKCLPEQCRTRTVANLLRQMRTIPKNWGDWEPKAKPGNKDLWPLLCDALEYAGGGEIAYAIRERMGVFA